MQVNRFSAADRVRLEEMINDALPLAYAAEMLQKHPTTLAREVKRNRIALPAAKRSKFRRNPCAHAKGCDITDLCGWKNCERLCSSCEFVHCYERCEHFIKWTCEDIFSWPFVCNRCRYFATCPEERLSYSAKKAEEAYRLRASITRRGIDMEAGELIRIDAIVTPLLMKGQSPYHVWIHHRYDLGISLATLYSYVNQGLFKAGRMHLPRAVNFRPRKKETEKREQQADKKGRSYSDYLIYLYGGEL